MPFRPGHPERFCQRTINRGQARSEQEISRRGPVLALLGNALVRLLKCRYLHSEGCVLKGNNPMAALTRSRRNRNTKNNKTGMCPILPSIYITSTDYQPIEYWRSARFYS